LIICPSFVRGFCRHLAAAGGTRRSPLARLRRSHGVGVNMDLVAARPPCSRPVRAPLERALACRREVVRLCDAAREVSGSPEPADRDGVCTRRLRAEGGSPVRERRDASATADGALDERGRLDIEHSQVGMPGVLSGPAHPERICGGLA
jgi:hypothetical protein